MWLLAKANHIRQVERERMSNGCSGVSFWPIRRNTAAETERNICMLLVWLKLLGNLNRQYARESTISHLNENFVMNF